MYDALIRAFAYVLDLCRFYFAVLSCMVESKTCSLVGGRIIVQIASKTCSFVLRGSRDVFWITPSTCLVSSKLANEIYMSPKKTACRVPLQPRLDSPLRVVLNEPGPISNDPHPIYRHLFDRFMETETALENRLLPL